MADIRVRKVNETYIKLFCRKDILKELAEKLTFYPPDYRYKKRKKKYWDGKIRLLNLGTRNIYFGLYRKFNKIAEELGYSVEYQESILQKNNFSLQEAQEYADSLNLHSGREKIEPRDYQIDAFHRAIRNQRILILSPTASGKSLIFYLKTRYLLEKGKKGLILTPSVQLVEQMFKDFQDYSSENKWDVSANIHKIYSGQDKVTDKPCRISTWQSLYTMEKEYFRNFNFILVDEADTAQANCLKGILEKATKTEYKIGLTGTLSGAKTHEMILEGLFGPIKQVISTKELMDRGELANIQIKCPILKYPEHICRNTPYITYEKEKDFLNSCLQRTKFIRNLALSLKGNTLILFRNIEDHGRLIFNEIQRKAGDRKVFFIYGGTELEERELIRNLIETEDDAIITASLGTFSRGINMKRLHNLIFAIGSKSRIRVLQSIGRGLRMSKDKLNITLFDIVDDMSYIEHENHALKHFRARMDMYDDESFPYKAYHISLRAQ